MFIYARSEQCDLIGGPTYLLILKIIKNLAVLHDFCLIFHAVYRGQLSGWSFKLSFFPGEGGWGIRQ